MTTIFHRLARAGALAMGLCLGGGAQAQLPEAQQASLIVPYPAGSTFDITARHIQSDLARSLGKTLIVENFGGASGSIGAQRLLSADPNQLTLLLASANELALPPLMLRGVRYKAEDFRMVAHVSAGVMAVLARPDYPAANLAELIDKAKRPGAAPLTFGSTGTGSIFHLAGVDFARKAGIAITHVPYKGGAPIIQDLMGSQVDVTFLPLIPSYIQSVQAGKLKLLGVLGPNRHAVFPQVQSVDEIPSVRGVHYSMWTGLFVPARMPAAAATLIGQAANKIVGSTEFRDWVGQRGNQAGTVMNLEQANAFYREEAERFARIAAMVGLERE